MLAMARARAFSPCGCAACTVSCHLNFVSVQRNPQESHLCSAEQDFAEGDVLFRQPPLVGALHAASRAAVLACGHCFRHIGSVELQTARRILAAVPAGHDGQEEQEEHGDGNSGGPATVGRQPDGTQSHCACAAADANSGGEAALDGLDATLLERLLNGCERLPRSDLFPLPAVVPCPGGCEDEAYCSAACSRAAWDGYHQLLCTGPAAPREPGTGLEDGGYGSAADEPRRKRSKLPARILHAHAHAQHEGCSSSGQRGVQRDGSCNDDAAEGAASRRQALAEFNAHADATNDIFHVAARLVAGVLLRGAALLRSEAVPNPARANSVPAVPSDRPPQGAAEHHSPAVVARQAPHSGSAKRQCAQSDPEPSTRWAALRRAWLPHAVAWKAVWWEAVALPPDVSDDAAFRQGSNRRCSSHAPAPVTTLALCGGC